MHRSLLLTTAFILVLLVSTQLPVSQAQVLPSNHNSYLAVVLKPLPVPRPIDIMLDVPSGDLPSGYGNFSYYGLTNDLAAQSFKDPQAALQAFTEQGRETQFIEVYRSTDIDRPVVTFEERVTRFLTPEGARAGEDFFLAVDKSDGYKPIASTDLYGRTFIVRYSKKINNDFTEYGQIILVQRGRFVVETRTTSFYFAVTVDAADSLSRLALNKLVRFVPEP